MADFFLTFVKYSYNIISMIYKLFILTATTTTTPLGV